MMEWTYSKAKGLILLAGLLVLLMAPLSSAQDDAGISTQDEDQVITWGQEVRYTVKEGDTLWSIAQRFYESPAQWPELWENNPELTRNPHWIKPGRVIILHKTQGELVIPKEEPEPVKLAALPEVEETRQVFRYPNALGIGFVRREKLEPEARIFRVVGKKTLISQGDKIYCEATGKDLYTEGDLFTIYRDEGELKNPFDGRKKLLGTQYRVVGTAYCETARPGLIVAIVQESYQPIRLGDMLTSFQEVPEEFLVRQGDKGVEGHIVASESRSSIIGQGDLVFLDRGKRQGLAVGEVYTVYEQLEGLEEGTLLPPLNYGQLIVLWTEDNTSTALITETSDIINPGAKFHYRLLGL
ncbi:MAG: LysM peptidoglycan-binding domain-containing protein, partial [Deltaproteobacteria bacterium]|nr:LysM peptidoglycan-binding domain-containing protein [Deltaproteobacteria bacterium]